MRNDAELLIYVDIEGSMKDGILWWLSENGVVLTEGDDEGVLKTKYFRKVEGRKGDVGVLWMDGEEVAELPMQYRNRKAPVGKALRGKGNTRGGSGNGRGRGGGRGKDGGGRRGGGGETGGTSLDEEVV